MTLVSRKERVPIELIPVLFYTIFSLLVPYDLRSRILFYSFTIVYCFLRVIVPFYRKIELEDTGVTFRLWVFTRYIPWERFIVRDVLDYNALNHYKGYNTSRYVVFFSKRRRDKRRYGLRFRSVAWLDEYCLWHFLSTFYIRVVNDDLRSRRNIDKDTYSKFGHDNHPLINMAEQEEIVHFFTSNRILVEGIEDLQ